MKCPWYVPSWNGDLSLLPHPKDEGKTVLSIVKPTLDEVAIANRIGAELLKRGWIGSWDPVVAKQKLLGKKSWLIDIQAPLVKVGPVVSSMMREGPGVMTAIRFASGRMEVSTGGPAELEALAEKITAEEKASAEAAAKKDPPYRTPASPLPPADDKALVVAAEPEKKPEAEPDKKPEAAVTVKRPTPCCPQCMPGAIEPASRVLLAFLSEAEHAQWREERCLTVVGGLSGHRYLVAHRNSRRAAGWGKICYDTDDEVVLHFHDNAVPPEEEVLATKLILEHREPWLRNEATFFGHTDTKYKNPFGGFSDGVPDSIFTESFGRSIATLFG
jgi:hypothetical protein